MESEEALEQWFSITTEIRIMWELWKNNARDAPQTNQIRIAGEWWLGFFGIQNRFFQWRMGKEREVQGVQETG